MLNWKQRLALRGAQKLLKGAGFPVWFDVRLIRDSHKDLGGARVNEVKQRDDVDELLRLIEAKRVALRPEYRIELRLYSSLVRTRGVFMGQEIPEPPPLPPPVMGPVTIDLRDTHPMVNGDVMTIEGPTVVVGTAPPFDKWSRSNALRPRARAAGVVLEAKPEQPPVPTEPDAALLRHLAMDPAMLSHPCNTDGPMRQKDGAGPFYPTCSNCGEVNAR